MDGRETMRRTGSLVQGEGLLDCWERDRNYPPEFFCQIHGDNSSHDTSDCIVTNPLHTNVATSTDSTT